MDTDDDRSPAVLPLARTLGSDDGVALACTLGSHDGVARLARWSALGEAGKPTAARSAHRLEVRYHAAPGVRDELEALVAAERRCCAFVAWDVSHDRHHVVLHVAADAGSADRLDPIAALFGA